MPTEAHPAHHFSGIESKTCQPSGPSTLLGGLFLLPLSPPFSVSPLAHPTSVRVSVLACPMPTSPVSISCSFSDSHPRPSCPLPPITTNRGEERPCQEDYLPVQTKGVFFVRLPVIFLQRDRSPSIHLCVCSRLHTLLGPLALFYSNNTVGEDYLGRGDA